MNKSSNSSEVTEDNLPNVGNFSDEDKQSPALKKHGQQSSSAANNIRPENKVGKDKLRSKRKNSIELYRLDDPKKASPEMDELTSIADVVFMSQGQSQPESAALQKSPRRRAPAVHELSSVGTFAKSDEDDGRARLIELKKKLSQNDFEPNVAALVQP